MSSPRDDAREVCEQLKRWLVEDAYPRWAAVGVDPADGFFEKVGMDGRPVDAPRRIRVASRQVYSFAQAGRLGWRGDWRGIVEHGLEALARYRRSDGLYAQLMSADGEILDDTPAPYEQAFVMLALLAAQEALGRDLEDQAALVREALKARLGRADGGFYEDVSKAGPLRANPHMHLFETAQAWTAVGRDAGWARMASDIGRLALERMIEPGTGALGELFDTDWRPLEEADVEPGHQFEWGWLLLRFGAAEAALRLIEIGERHGVDPARDVAFNALSADLRPRDLSARLWPQCERIKAGAAAAMATGEDRYWTMAADGGRGLARYLQTGVPGLWCDRMTPDGSMIDEAAPASSFYHIVGGIFDLDRALA
ncbi:MAG TPA: AGE family epimerase/isomerase [Caulobacteraceae bacterium]